MRSKSMKLSSVRLSVRPSVRPSVCLSVCLSHHSAAARHCGGFAAVGPAASGYRSIAARPALSSKCEQCHVVKLNTDLLASFCPSLSSVESGNRAVVEGGDSRDAMKIYQQSTAGDRRYLHTSAPYNAADHNTAITDAAAVIQLSKCD